jgi:hypothetical protein
MTIPGWLTTLLEKGVVGYTAANRGVLDELLTLEIVSVRSRGIRRTVVATQPDQLSRWTAARYPDHGIDPDRLATRQGNIVRSGRSKAGRSAHAVLPFSFKWFGSPDEPWTRLTHKFGMAAIMTDRLSDLALPKRWHLLTIENWEPFHRADYTGARVPMMVVYLGGNAPDILIEALRNAFPPPSRAVHFGDFDWDGLYIFQRLKAALPAVRLYVPDNIESLFQHFGDRQLIDRQTPKAAFDWQNKDCRPVVELIEQTNAGLEQEVVDLPPSV